jgi:hypothetical protein
MFYESYHTEKPNDELPIQFCLAHGIFDVKKATELMKVTCLHVFVSELFWSEKRYLIFYIFLRHQSDFVSAGSCQRRLGSETKR